MAWIVDPGTNRVPVSHKLVFTIPIAQGAAIAAIPAVIATVVVDRELARQPDENGQPWVQEEKKLLPPCDRLLVAAN